jgi:hypothetical protein
MGFLPDDNPGAVLPCELALNAVSAIVGFQTEDKIIGLANVEPASRVLEYIDPVHRARRLAPLTRVKPELFTELFHMTL